MLRLGWVFAATALALTSVIALAGCGQMAPPYMHPLSAQTRALLAEKGMREDSPILVRIFKAESELEIWKQRDDGRYYHFKTYPICSWSGDLGPKVTEGDRQAPEGFYLVSAAQMNPHSAYHLSFNIGFPNAYDRSNGHSGGDIMVHGDCKSAGCYAMTDAVIEEIFILARESLEGGQPAFQVQAFPFRMTAENMARHRDDKWYPFWKNLKDGYDSFEVSHLPPKIDVCDRHYLINASFTGGAQPDPSSACPAYQHMSIPRTPVLQQAVIKGPAPSGAGAGWQTQTTSQNHSAAAEPAAPPAISTADASASITEPLGSLLHLTFGPSKPTYQAFTLGPPTATASEGQP